MRTRNDKTELTAALADAESRSGGERARLLAQRVHVLAMREDERLETYEEAAARLGISGLITVEVVIANGIVRQRVPQEPDPVRAEPVLPAVPPKVP